MARKSEKELEGELKLSYCNFCQSRNILIVRTITVKCKDCGKMRVIQAKV